MKTINDYTKEEIIALTDDKITNLISLSKAQSGIKLLKKPVEPTYNEIPPPDKTIFKVSGVNIYFEKRETAEEISKILRSNFSTLREKTYDYSVDSEYEYDKPISSRYGFNNAGVIIVEELSVYSFELYTQIKGKLEYNKQLKNVYDKDKKEYDKENDIALDIVNNIYDKINEVKKEQQEKEKMLERYQEYLKLAEQNQDIAWTFLKKAYSISTDIEDYIKANI